MTNEMTNDILWQIARLDRHFGGSQDTKEILFIPKELTAKMRGDRDVSNDTAVQYIKCLVDAIIIRDPFTFLIEEEKTGLIIPLLKYIKQNADKIK